MRQSRSPEVSEAVPLFPLPNCTLLPGCVLPLRVFEPRYRVMVEDLHAKPPNKRWIAIALLAKNSEDHYFSPSAPIHRTVGLGEVLQILPLPERCFNILVVGRARARVVEEHSGCEYRTASLELMPTEPADLLAGVHESVERVRSVVNEYTELGLCDADFVKELTRRAPSAATLIDILAFHLLGPQDTIVKQRILEAEALESRADLLNYQLHKLMQGWRQAQVCHVDRPFWSAPCNLN